MARADKNKILLVEDDPDTRYALSVLFEMEGFVVVPAEDGHEAYLKAMTEEPDVIVTDINMPKVNGLDLIRLIKENRTLAGVPIVAMSAVEKQHLNRALEAGAVAVYQKPIEFDQFLSMIARVVSARHSRNRTHVIPDLRKKNGRDRGRN